MMRKMYPLERTVVIFVGIGLMYVGFSITGFILDPGSFVSKIFIGFIAFLCLLPGFIVLRAGINGKIPRR